MKQLLPILKNRIEKEKQEERGMFIEDLFSGNNSPIIMYGEDNGNFIAYTPAKTDEEKKKVKEKALSNLKKIEVPYQIEDMGDYKIIIAQHEYAAEKILDQDFMNKLSQVLESKSIVVGIPEKGFLTAVAKGKGESNLYGAVKKMYAKPNTYALSDAMFLVTKGEIEMMTGNNEDSKRENEMETFNLSGKNNEKGKLVFTAKIGHKTEDGLADLIQEAFGLFMIHGMKDPKNTYPQLDIFIDHRYTKMTPQLRERIKKIAKNITERGGALLIQELTGEKFKVRFYYGDNQLIAETGEPNTHQVGNNKKTTKKQTENSKPWWKFWK